MKSVSVSQKAYSLLMFFAVSVLSGLLLAGLAVPLTALAGGVTRMAAESVQYLPEDLETPPQSERSQILMADGSVLATFFDENRIYVELSDISPWMQDAIVDIEDHRFYEHGAIDPQGLMRAVVRTAMGDTQGASTLTQQYVKLVQVEAAHVRGDDEGVRAAQEVTIERKIREMRYAMAIEERLSKQEILEGYLNIAYFGDGAYGVEAAARHYWGTTAKELTLDQAAMLAGLVQNPVQTNPARYPERATDRRDVVLNRMAQLGTITQDQADEAKAVEFDPDGIQRTPNGCYSSEFPFLCDYVVRTLESDKMPSLGATQEERENMLKRGGLTVQTLIDPEAQRSAEAAVAAQISPFDPLIATTSLIQPSTGLIVAMAQSRPAMGDGPGETHWDYNNREGYQTGSTYKVFGVAAALQAGMTPSKQYNSPYQMQFDGEIMQGCLRDERYRQTRPISNYDRSYGMIDMIRATQNSVNTYFAQLAVDIGNCNIKELAEDMGLVFTASESHLNETTAVPNMILGTAEVTPLSMTSAYATLANRGVHCEPIILERVTNQDGDELPVPDANCTRVLDEEVADGVSYILESVMTNGTGRPARIADGRPQAGKTGTTQSAEAVWFAGYTPDLAGSSMITIDRNSEFYKERQARGQSRSVRAPVLENGRRLAGTGGGDAGQMWRTAMGEALKDTPRTEFNEVSDRVLEGIPTDVPDVSGMSFNQARETLEAAGFTTTVWRPYSNRPEGTFLGISPSDTAPRFSTIQMRVSAGPRPEPTPTPQPSSSPSSDESDGNDGGSTSGGTDSGGDESEDDD